MVAVVDDKNLKMGTPIFSVGLPIVTRPKESMQNNKRPAMFTDLSVK
jgi:hypothetical protein